MRTSVRFALDDNPYYFHIYEPVRERLHLSVCRADAIQFGSPAEQQSDLVLPLCSQNFVGAYVGSSSQTPDGN